MRLYYLKLQYHNLLNYCTDRVYFKTVRISWSTLVFQQWVNESWLVSFFISLQDPAIHIESVKGKLRREINMGLGSGI